MGHVEEVKAAPVPVQRIPTLEARVQVQEPRVAVITGATGGLGRNLAQAFAKAGYHLVLHYHRNREVAEALADGLRNGVETSTFRADLASSSGADALLQHAQEEFGQVDVLVNNAGVNRDALVHRIRDDDWETVLRTNVTSAMYCTRAALPGMYKRGHGRIVLIGSTAGQKGFIGSAAYATSKAALMGFTKVVAREAARHQVTCNVIAPGVLEAGMGHALSDKAAEALMADTPMRRFGDPQDVGELAVFLSGPAGGFITGQVIGINGGLYM